MAEGLAGKIAPVTGGAAGIGRVIALTFAKAGATVIIADVDEGSAAETVRRLSAAGGTAHAITTDVTRAAVVCLYIADKDTRLPVDYHRSVMAVPGELSWRHGGLTPLKGKGRSNTSSVS